MSYQRKQFRNIWLIAALALTLFVNTNHTIVATDFQPECYASLYWLSDSGIKKIPKDRALDEVSLGETLQIEFNIRSEAKGDGTIGISQISGVQYVTYYPGVLKINNNNASEQQYQQFLTKNGMNTNFDSNTYTLEVKYVGTKNGLTTFDLSMSMGGNHHSHGFEYKSDFHISKTYVINFYDGDALVSRQIVPRKQSAYIPIFEKKEYDFIGYNVKRDGSGTYYRGKPIYEDATYYAIYTKKEFRVTYYVDQYEYAKKLVKYGEDAESLEVISVSGEPFLGWDGDLRNVTENRSVYARFGNLNTDENSKEKASKFSGRLSILKQMDGSDKLLKSSTTRFQYNKSGELIKINSTNSQDNIMSYSNMHDNPLCYILLFILVLCSVGGVYFWKKKKN